MDNLLNQIIENLSGKKVFKASIGKEELIHLEAINPEKMAWLQKLASILSLKLNKMFPEYCFPWELGFENSLRIDEVEVLKKAEERLEGFLRVARQMLGH